jgi:glutathione S-transferase
MKLYQWGPAPNPRRVRIYLAEKNLQLPTEDVGAGWSLKPEYLTRTAHRLTPMLELDDGTMLGEAMAICRYLEGLHPEPPLFGRDAKERALVDMWERKCENQGMAAAAEVFRNALPAYVDRGLGGYDVPIPQIPALVERGKIRMDAFYKSLDHELSTHRFIVGDYFSVADITALCAIDFARRVKVAIPESCSHLLRWHSEVSARPSAKA